MEKPIEYTVIVETYNIKEGTSWDRFRTSLASAVTMTSQEGGGEVLVVDVWGIEELDEVLAEEFPQVRRLKTIGTRYDDAKLEAAKTARGRYLLYLDGDCMPVPDWHHQMLEILRSGKAIACGGYTRYDGGFWAAIMTVMDWGFFYPLASRPLQCYASNNSGFLRETLENIPVPEADMRCRCFPHARELLRRGTPFLLVPEARVLHELPPIVRERTRRGYDIIASCWSDPSLFEARWLRGRIFSLPLFYGMNVLLDWYRICLGWKNLELPFWQFLIALPLFPILRLLDAIGMARALLRGPTKGGWGGYS